MKRQQIQELIKVSKEVIKESSLENGAIVAANSDKLSYPSTVQDYRRFWVRDAAYICMSADLLGLENIPERFFDWCLNRAEGFNETGIFQNAYNVNGTIGGTLVYIEQNKVLLSLSKRYINLIHHGTQFQPDQNGSLLITIDHHISHFGIDNISRFEKLIDKTASGISNAWKKNKFILPYFDLWEERCILPAQKRYHTYSLAMCIAGLRVASKLLGKKKKWSQTETEMSGIFHDLYSQKTKTIPRTYTIGQMAKRRDIIKKEDFWPDSSLLGLIFPSGVLDPFDRKMKRTVDRIIQRNMIDGRGGFLRCQNDKYCGGIKKGKVTLTGAGVWPLLSFWMSIYFALHDDKKNAKRYLTWPLKRIDNYIPEQIFKTKRKESICPLVWSHSMFVLAAKFLGYL